VIAKVLDEITETDLQALVTAGVAERKTIEYKRELPPGNDAAKKEFLADVSSFANTVGGDLLYGVTDNNGIPAAIPGVQVGDQDEETRRLDQIILSGLDPRIQHTTRAARLGSGSYVFIIRIEHSWYGPHRVVFKNDGKFYARTSAGKYELDVSELRTAFGAAAGLKDRIASFRSERIIAIENNRAIIPLRSLPKLVLHCLPLQSFADLKPVDIGRITGDARIAPIATRLVSGYGWRTNFEGRALIGHGFHNPDQPDEPNPTYTQVFRNGAVEVVCTGLLGGNGRMAIPSQSYEQELLRYMPTCFRIVESAGLGPPVLLGVTLVGVQGLTMGLGVNEVLAHGSGGAH
jgi:hypothetical protein